MIWITANVNLGSILYTYFVSCPLLIRISQGMTQAIASCEFPKYFCSLSFASLVVCVIIRCAGTPNDCILWFLVSIFTVIMDNQEEEVTDNHLHTLCCDVEDCQSSWTVCRTRSSWQEQCRDAWPQCASSSPSSSLPAGKWDTSTDPHPLKTSVHRNSLRIWIWMVIVTSFIGSSTLVEF